MSDKYIVRKLTPKGYEFVRDASQPGNPNKQWACWVKDVGLAKEFDIDEAERIATIFDAGTVAA